MKKVLLTNLMLCDFTGSELHILSIAKQFKKRGYEVICAVIYSAYPMRYLAEKYEIKLIHITEETLPYKHYDVVFGQHGIVLDYLIFHNEITYKKLILSVLSPMELFEYPSYFEESAQLILANSLETKNKLIRYGINREKIRVFPNYAEDEYFNNYNIRVQNRLEKILIVSNHLPKELIGLKNILEADKIKCDVVGIQGEKVLITAEIIKQYDLVITIGKTIQYCFAMGIPVYCYDIWGGPGYINKNNFIQAEEYNFSGRGFDRRLSAQELYEDILEGYKQALEQLAWLNRISHEKYDLNKNFEDVINIPLAEERILNYKEHTLRYLMVSNEALIREVYHRIKSKLFYTEVYYDYGSGFLEEKKKSYPIVGNSNITLIISIPSGVKSIRFDPVGGVFCRCNLDKINNEQAENKIIESNRVRKENGKDIFYTFDPQYELYVDAQKQLDIEYSVEIIPNYKNEGLLKTCIEALQRKQMFEEMLQEKDSALVEKDKLIGNQVHLIEEKDRALQEKDRMLREKDYALVEKDNIISNQTHLIEEKDRVLQKRDIVLQEINRVLQEKGKILVEREQIINEYNDCMKKNRLEVESLKVVNTRQLQQLESIYNSRYWKLGQFIKKYLKIN